MKNEALIIVDMSKIIVADDGTLTAGKPAQEIVPYIRNKADESFSASVIPRSSGECAVC